MASGVTRVKGQPGQLTNKQLSWQSAEHSWVGGRGSRSQKPTIDHFLIFMFEFVHFEAYDFRNYFIFCFMYIWKVFWYFVKIFI